MNNRSVDAVFAKLMGLTMCALCLGGCASVERAQTQARPDIARSGAIIGGHTVQEGPILAGESLGVELHSWDTTADIQALQAALQAVARERPGLTAAYGPEVARVWQSYGFTLHTFTEDDLKLLQEKLPVRSRADRSFLGQTRGWVEVAGERAAAIRPARGDGGQGRLRVLGSAWVAPAADKEDTISPVLRVRLVLQEVEDRPPTPLELALRGSTDRDEAGRGLVDQSTFLGFALREGQIVVLAAPAGDAAGALPGPGPALPIGGSVAQRVLWGLAGEDQAGRILAIVPRVPDRFSLFESE